MCFIWKLRESDSLNLPIPVPLYYLPTGKDNYGMEKIQFEKRNRKGKTFFFLLLSLIVISFF